jgi:hypothetical protein
MTRLYLVWGSMRKRCICPTVPDWPRYGGRGIMICAEWNDYGAFRAWALSSGYRKGLTLDRENSNGRYEPTNCRWIPKGEQQDNVRKAIRLTLDGQTRSIYRWARLRGMSPDLIRCRVYNGWSDEQALTLPRGTLRPGQLRGRAAAKAKRIAASSR